jgi:hypothetical protein
VSVVEIIWKGVKQRVGKGRGTVSYRTGTLDTAKDAFLKQHGLRLWARWLLKNGRAFDDIVLPDDLPAEGMADALESLMKDPIVTHVGPDNVGTMRARPGE